MNIQIINSTRDLTGHEQKTLYNAGVGIDFGAYFLVTNVENVFKQGNVVDPATPALRALTNAANIDWVVANFRGNSVAFGTVM